ncbi:MAG: DUF3043 domain-containing protein [Actinomycetota bacterium]|nr:DUF3043 domain-containing protein [Actinomycetota bacterium]
MKLPSVKLPGLGRRQADQDTEQRRVEETQLEPAAVGKGRPTPKRRDAQGRRSGPPPPPPTTRKEAYRRMRETQASGRKNSRAAASAGVESALPRRDQGPARKLVRNIVDSRRNIGSVFLLIAALVLVGYFIPDTRVRSYTVLLWMAFFVAIIVDSIFLGRRIKRTVAERLPDAPESNRALIWYGVTRATMVRRWRFPKPAVSVGDEI